MLARTPFRSLLRPLGFNPALWGSWWQTLDDRLAALPLFAWLDPADLSTAYISTSGTSSLAAHSNPVGYRADRSGNGHHGIAPADDRRPKLDITSGVVSDVYDGVNDTLTIAATTTLPADCNVFVALRTVDSRGILIGDSTNTHHWVLPVWDGNSAPYFGGFGTVYNSIHVDGERWTRATMDDMHTVLSDGAWHVVDVRGLDLSMWADFTISGYAAPGYELGGNIGPIVIIETANLTDDIRNEIILPWFRGRVGL